MRTRSSLNVLFACLIFIVTLAASQSQAETRRAFLIGNQAYKDGDIKQLRRAINDAKDVAKDLEEVGFDKKNIKVVTDIKNKNAFDKEFDAFLRTVEAGDTVFFYFSGHGFGVEAEQNNYLLFTDLKSPFSFTRAKLSEKERKDAAVVRSKVKFQIEAYHADEIPLSGVATTEIEQKIYQRRPKTVMMVLDACRSLVKTGDAETDDATAITGASGSRMITTRQPPRNFLVLYSAAFGEQAVESLVDAGRNSLFTEIFRAEMMRPGQSLKDLAERVKLMVRATAQSFNEQQEPEYVANGPNLEESYLIDPIGQERFRTSEEKCKGGDKDWGEIKNRRKRELFERHIRRFDGCGTAEYARRRLSELTLSADDSDEFQDRCLEAKDDWQKIRDRREPEKLASHIQRFDGCATGELARRWLAARGAGGAGSADRPPASAPGTRSEDRIRSISECDLLAASDLDRDRPPDVPGLPFEKIIADDAIEACTAELTPKEGGSLREPNARYLFNLGRAYHRRASNSELGADERYEAWRRARQAYEGARARSYSVALGHLASLLETGDAANRKEALDLLKLGAAQRQPHAMYLLGLRFRDGNGVERSPIHALEWFRSAAEGGIVAAKVEAGDALINRRPRWDPRTGVQLLQEAAEAGSTRAQWLLAITYSKGAMRRCNCENEKAMNEVRKDDDLALLWWARLAEQGDTAAQAVLADRMQNGLGLSAPQPDASERYWRLAAQGGNPTAQVTFADRMRRGFVLVKQEYGAGDEGIKVLKQAMSQGSAQAALALAEIYRAGELGQAANRRQAVAFAFNAMDLATQTDATPRLGEPFPEIAAAHLLVEMAKTNQAVDNTGSPLLTSEEVERLERFYGKVDSSSKQVKIRRLAVPLTCGFGDLRYYKELKESRYDVQWRIRRWIWVWDWGRLESPTEFQFRSLERETGCDKNNTLRRTLIDIYDQSRKHGVPYADLVEQKVKIAMQETTAPTRGKKRGGGRRR